MHVDQPPSGRARRLAGWQASSGAVGHRSGGEQHHFEVAAVGLVVVVGPAEHLERAAAVARDRLELGERGRPRLGLRRAGGVGADQARDEHRFKVPVAADESILDFEELQARARYFDVINIKLDKCGGLTEALRMARSARLHGLQVMVGNMGGSTLAMAPGFVVGQLCDVVDLDGPFGLADDPLADKIYSGGMIYVPQDIWGGP